MSAESNEVETFEEVSRRGWGRKDWGNGNFPTDQHLQLGALLRIAAAADILVDFKKFMEGNTETHKESAKNFREWYKEESVRAERMERKYKGLQSYLKRCRKAGRFLKVGERI